MGDYKLQREVKTDEKELHDIFYGDSVMMASIPKFYEKLKEDEIVKGEKQIPFDEAKFYYDNQEVKQVFEPFVQGDTFKHIVALYPFERVFIDTMYVRLDNSTNAYLNIVDVFTKYAFSQMFVIPHKTQALTSMKAMTMFNAFRNDIKTKYHQDIGIVYTDRGSEFEKDFSQNLEKEDIPRVWANTGDKRKGSPIERFNKTLRWYIEKYRTIYGRMTNKSLQTIIAAYNNMSHAGLKHSPIEIIQSKPFQLEVEKHFLMLRQENGATVIPDGTKVRILLDRSVFQKIKPVWSKKIHTVQLFSNGNYTLVDDDGYYKQDQLQPINTTFLMEK